MNDTLKKLSNILDLHDNGVLSELDLLMEMHDLWRATQNMTQSAKNMIPDFESVYRILDFTYIHFKETVDARLKEANK